MTAEVIKNLSEHFSLAELTKTNVKIKNVPNEAQVENLKRLCGWLEMLRERAEGPIIINSGYRSPQLNKKIGGVANSNHTTGCASDIRVKDEEQLIRFANIVLDYAKESHQEFDELLIEKNRYGAIWLHLAVRPKVNRHKVRILHVG